MGYGTQSLTVFVEDVEADFPGGGEVGGCKWPV
jgi:hypothetical protein